MTGAELGSRLAEGRPMLADGGIETALVYERECDLPELQTIGMLDDPAGRRAMAELWGDYLAVAGRFELPMVVGTPSWRGGPDRILGAGHPARDVQRLNTEAVDFQRENVAEAGMVGSCFIAGVLGPRGDGYDPSRAPGADEAAAYHAEQSAVLAAAGVDLLFAVPLPSADEAVGVSRAMARTGTPYVPSLLADARGRLPDGTPVPEVISRLLDEAEVAPLHISISCVHPRTLDRAVTATGGDWSLVRELKANGSPLPPSVLDRATRLECDAPESWADAMIRVGERLDLAVLGGCCGTGPDHLQALAARLAGRSELRAAPGAAPPHPDVGRP
jgi:S-methylmethionine-dependent homocysteine/selenocysteine methylase